MITEDYVSFETAKLLKEKGFDEKVDTLYKMDAEFLKSTLCINYNNPDFELSDMHHIPEKTVSAPTLQMALKWLREKHEIFIQPNIVFCYPIQYFATIFCYGDNLKTQQDIDTERFDTYEEACEAGIKYCLENLI
jgi:hypothetical protein